MKPTCPKCGGRIRMLNTEPNREGSRSRRYGCQDCGHRFSTIEVPLDWVEELRDLRQLRSQLRGLVGGSKVALIVSCDQCVHWYKDNCGLGIPEAGATFATDCSSFDHA